MRRLNKLLGTRFGPKWYSNIPSCTDTENKIKNIVPGCKEMRNI